MQILYFKVHLPRELVNEMTRYLIKIFHFSSKIKYNDGNFKITLRKFLNEFDRLFKIHEEEAEPLSDRFTLYDLLNFREKIIYQV